MVRTPCEKQSSLLQYQDVWLAGLCSRRILEQAPQNKLILVLDTIKNQTHYVALSGRGVESKGIRSTMDSPCRILEHEHLSAMCI